MSCVLTFKIDDLFYFDITNKFEDVLMNRKHFHRNKGKIIYTPRPTKPFFVKHFTKGVVMRT